MKNKRISNIAVVTCFQRLYKVIKYTDFEYDIVNNNIFQIHFKSFSILIQISSRFISNHFLFLFKSVPDQFQIYKIIFKI